MPAGRGLHPALPGLAVAAVVGIAATFLSLQYRASAMLFALLLGMALNFLAEEGRCLPGIQLASTVVLRVGVALLGLRITLAQVEALGWSTVLLVVAGVALTLVTGLVAARLLGLGSQLGTLTGGAVAICEKVMRMPSSATPTRSTSREVNSMPGLQEPSTARKLTAMPSSSANSMTGAW